MKKNTMTMMVILLVVIATPAISNTTNEAKIITSTAEPKTTNPLIERLEEIKEMDKTDMSFQEKRTLRKEVKSINKELKRANGGVYISVGGAIIILLLVILLL